MVVGYGAMPAHPPVSHGNGPAKPRNSTSRISQSHHRTQSERAPMESEEEERLRKFNWNQNGMVMCGTQRDSDLPHPRPLYSTISPAKLLRPWQNEEEVEKEEEDEKE